MSTKPSTVIGALIRAQLAGIRVGLPGRIVAYDPIKQRADVQPLVMDGALDEDGGRITTTLPVLTDVPVCFPGAGPWRLTFPIAVGDTVELRFMSSSIARWKLTGGLVDPGDDRHHALPDAIAIPDLHDYAHVPTDAPTDAMVLHGDAIRLGGVNADDPVALESTLLTVKPAILAGLDAQIAALTAGLPATADELAEATALREEISTSWPVCSVKVKAT